VRIRNGARFRHGNGCRFLPKKSSFFLWIIFPQEDTFKQPTNLKINSQKETNKQMAENLHSENTLGWACLISTLKGHLFGAMEHRLTFITGRSTNQTTFAMKNVSIPLGLFVHGHEYK